MSGLVLEVADAAVEQRRSFGNEQVESDFDERGRPRTWTIPIESQALVP